MTTIRTMWVARRQAKITQQELADRLGVTQPRISAWETGKTPIPRARRWEIAQMLGIETHELDEEIEL